MDEPTTRVRFPLPGNLQPIGLDNLPAPGRYDQLMDAANVDNDAFEIRADCEPELSYPVEIFIDFNRSTADEELGWVVSELRPS